MPILENLESEKMEIELKIPMIENKKKRVKKGSKIVISEEIDEKISTIYKTTEENIMDISKNNKILVWQVVSILVNNSLIMKRSDARGYEIYKETDEYKNKINKND